MQTPGVGYVRVAAFAAGAAGRLEQAVAQLARGGAASVIVDLRDTAEGRLEEGIAAARPFVPAGKTLSTRETKAGKDTAVTTTASDGKVTTPLVLLTTNGTSGAAELFAAALLDNKRATLVGEHTLGRAGVQKLVKLPDGSALYMTYARYLGPSGAEHPRHRPDADRRRRAAGARVRRRAADERSDPREGARAGPREEGGVIRRACARDRGAIACRVLDSN